MRRTANRNSGSGLQRQRRSVAQILRASYERFAKDKETLAALKAVLRSEMNTQS